MIRAKTAWLTLNDRRIARIWAGLSGFGGLGSSVTRNEVFFPCSYASASSSACLISSKIFTFLFPDFFIFQLLLLSFDHFRKTKKEFALFIREILLLIFIQQIQKVNMVATLQI
jgi:hypothetical protein